MNIATAIVLLIATVDLLFFSLASVISKSSKDECVAESDVKNINNTVCSTKLVVALTITANEVAIMHQAS